MDFALKNGLDIISQKLDFDFGLFNISARQNAEKGYRIVKKGCEVLIEYSTKSSFFSAVLSLMARENEDFEESRSMFNGNLGLMVDSARNGVFNTESIKLFIINAALCGYNYLQLYVEDCMQIDGEPYFGHQRGAYTKEEIKEVVSFGEIFGIELMPCIRTIKHRFICPKCKH
jgi:hexosaminidase